MSDSINLTRRDWLLLAGTAAGATLTEGFTTGVIQSAEKRRKRVIVVGAGIGGLCCAYELMDRGHDVTVLEASGRTGGHVKTIHDPLPDGLYADVGAEHFTKPGYDQFWKYVNKFNLTALPYPRRQNMLRRIDGKWYTEEKLQDREVLKAFNFNQREIDFIVQHGWTELPLLYLGPYLDAFKDEYQPFGAGFDQFDEITAGELLAKDGASDAALRFNGVRRGDGSPAARNGEVSGGDLGEDLAVLKFGLFGDFDEKRSSVEGSPVFGGGLGELKSMVNVARLVPPCLRCDGDAGGGTPSRPLISHPCETMGRGSRYSTCFRSGCPSASNGCSKSPAGSCVMPSRSMTRRERTFSGTVNETISCNPSSWKPNATAARAASVAKP